MRRIFFIFCVTIPMIYSVTEKKTFEERYNERTTLSEKRNILNEESERLRAIVPQDQRLHCQAVWVTEDTKLTKEYVRQVDNMLIALSNVQNGQQQGSIDPAIVAHLNKKRIDKDEALAQAHYKYVLELQALEERSSNS